MEIFRVIKEGTKSVPAVKYAIGVAALVATVALIASLKIDLKVAVWGTVVLVATMVVLLVFAKLAAAPSSAFRLPARTMMWFCIVLFITICVMLTTSVFFKVPVDLQFMLINRQSAPGSKSKSSTPLRVISNNVSVNYMRLFGALEVPYLMAIINHGGQNLRRYNGEENRYFLNNKKWIEMNGQVVDFYRKKWEFKDAIPLRTKLWDQYFQADTRLQIDENAFKIYYSALKPDVPDFATFGFAISDDWEGYMDGFVADAIEDDILPYLKNKKQYSDSTYNEYMKSDLKLPEALKSSDIGFLFVILTNSAKASLYNLSLSYLEYVNMAKITKTNVYDLFYYWEVKKDPDLCGLTDDSLRSMDSFMRRRDLNSVRLSVRRKSDDMRLAELKPGESLIWTLAVYKKNANGLPKHYLGNIITPKQITYTLNGQKVSEIVREPYGLKAARMVVPQGWVGQ